MVHDDWCICVLSLLCNELAVEVSNDPARLMWMGDKWTMCQVRMISIDLCMTTMESYHQFADVTSMHEVTRVLYQQLYDGHRRIGRYSR